MTYVKIPNTYIYIPDYAELIQASIVKRDGTPIPNGTIEHATMLIEAMLRNAKSSVRILTGELNARLYGTEQIILAARQFLSDFDRKLEIVVEGKPEDKEIILNPLIVAIKSSPNLKIWRLKPERRDQLKSHFALMDDDSYRYEPDKEEPSAIAAFGDKTFTKQLDKIFEGLKGPLISDPFILSAS
jgi:hypothetical protein